MGRRELELSRRPVVVRRLKYSRAMLRTRSGLVLPEGTVIDRSQLRQQYRCMVPGCGETFPEQHKAAYEAHVAKCARQNMGEIRAESPRVKAPAIFGEEGVDVEYRDWLRKRHHGDGPRRV